MREQMTNQVKISYINYQRGLLAAKNEKAPDRDETL